MKRNIQNCILREEGFTPEYFENLRSRAEKDMERFLDLPVDHKTKVRVYTTVLVVGFVGVMALMMLVARWI